MNKARLETLAETIYMMNDRNKAFTFYDECLESSDFSVKCVVNDSNKTIMQITFMKDCYRLRINTDAFKLLQEREEIDNFLHTHNCTLFKENASRNDLRYKYIFVAYDDIADLKHTLSRVENAYYTSIRSKRISKTIASKIVSSAQNAV